MTTQLNPQLTVSHIAHGLMLMTWVPNPVPDEQAFEAIKASLDSVPEGTKMILNSCEFYGFTPREANLQLVSRFFEKYPEYTDKAFISVKGGINFEKYAPDSTNGFIRQSVDNCLDSLRGKKKMDLFQCARVDQTREIEETIAFLATLVKEGKFDYIGLSECSAATLRRAHAVHPITLVEIEISPWSYEEETRKVIETARELGVGVVGYSPLGSGFLTGKITDASQATELLKNFPRFQDDAIKKNLKLVEGIKRIAEQKGCTPAQLCLAWVRSLGPHVIPMPGSSHAKRTLENIASLKVEMTPEDMKEMEAVMSENEVVGTRYPEHAMSHTWG